MIPQKKKLSNDFLETFLETTIKKIGHRASLRAMIGQFYPIYAYTGTNHALLIISSVQDTLCGS